MSVEANKALVRRYIEAINAGGGERFDDLIAEHYLDWRPQRPPARIADREWLKHYVDGLRATFPDLHLTVEDLVAEGDKVVVRWTGRGTHRGEMHGLAPTGRQVTWSGVAIQRIADSRIAETWLYADDLGLRQQLAGHS